MAMAVVALWEDISTSILVQFIVALVAIACCSRLVTGTLYHNGSTETLPYWLPYFGHFILLFYDWNEFLQRIRYQARDDVLSLYALGRDINVCFNDGQSPAAVRERQLRPNLDLVTFRWHLLVNVHGADPNPAHVDRARILEFETFGSLLADGQVSRVIERMVPDLVSNNESLVDQQLWERQADAHPKEQIYGMKTRLVTEASFVQLINNFVGHVLFTAVLGEDFIETYPLILDQLSDIDNGWKYLAFGLPRWIPPPATMKAHFARRRCHTTLRAFHAALDTVAKGEEGPRPWDDLASITPYMKSRHASMREHRLSARTRAALDLAALHRLYAKVSSLTCWLLLHIISTARLGDRIRDEVRSYVRVKQDPAILGFSVSPQLTIDTEGLEKSCSLLRVCFELCVKRYCPTVSIGMVKDAFKVDGDTHKISLRNGKSKSHMKPSSYSVLIPSRTHNIQAAFDQIVVEEPVEVSSNRPASSHEDSDPCEDSERAIILSLVAGILSVWDITPDSATYGKIPKPKASSLFLNPTSDARMTIAQRQLNDN